MTAHEFAKLLALPRQSQQLVTHLVQPLAKSYPVLGDLILQPQAGVICLYEGAVCLALCSSTLDRLDAHPALQSAREYTSAVVRSSSINDRAYFSSISARDRKNTATCCPSAAASEERKSADLARRNGLFYAIGK
jgi:hypothetical protein